MCWWGSGVREDKIIPTLWIHYSFLQRQSFLPLSTVCLSPTLIIFLWCFVEFVQVHMKTYKRGSRIQILHYSVRGTACLIYFLLLFWCGIGLRLGSDVYLYLTTDKLNMFTVVCVNVYSMDCSRLLFRKASCSDTEGHPGLLSKKLFLFLSVSLSLFPTQRSGNNKPEKTEFNETTWLHQSFC